jgi:hypothetical protein
MNVDLDCRHYVAGIRIIIAAVLLNVHNAKESYSGSNNCS